MRKTLIIHIGMHKTGSTAIQHFLSRNRLALRLFGILYPATYNADGSRQPKQNTLFTAISHEADFGLPHPALGRSDGIVADLADQLRRSRCRTGIISAEGLSGEKPDFAKALAPLAQEFDIRVVIFLRRPDEWLESFYRQMVISREVRETRSIQDFLNDPATQSHLDYPQMLGWWADVFGLNALYVCPYDLAAKQNVVTRFIRAAGLQMGLSYLPHSRARKNSGRPDRDVLLTLRENRAAGSQEEEIRLSDPDRKLLSEQCKQTWTASEKASVRAIFDPPFISFMFGDGRGENA